MKRHVRHLLAAVCLPLFVAVLSGCYTVDDYARQYQRGERTSAAARPSVQLRAHLAATKEARVRYHGSAERAEHIARCEYLRAQLHTAALTARDHTFGLWANPLLWPFHVLTGFYWPVSQTGLAWEIEDAARPVETAYQNSDDAFLRACEAAKNTPIGQTFWDAQPTTLEAAARNRATTRIKRTRDKNARKMRKKRRRKR